MPRANISGRQIRDESLETQDIKNGTILLEDLNQEIISLLSGSTSLSTLLDVLIPNPADGEALTYSASSGLWESALPGTPGSGQGSGIVNEFIYRDTSAGNLTYTLPDALSEDGKMYIVKKFSHFNKLTILTTGANTIDGENNFVLREYEALTLKSYNGEWYIV